MRPVGGAEPTRVRFYRGSDAGFEMLNGHWPAAAGEVAASAAFLTQNGLTLGDTLTLEADGKQLPVRVVGEVLMGSDEPVLSSWVTLARFAPGSRADRYEVKLSAGADVAAYVAAVRAGDPDLDAEHAHAKDTIVVAIYSTVTLLTLLLGSVATLGVFNTVVLNTRERRRDLMQAIARAARIVIPDHMLDVYSLRLVVLLLLAGAMIAAAGALLPSRSAARLTIAEALHTE